METRKRASPPHLAIGSRCSGCARGGVFRRRPVAREKYRTWRAAVPGGPCRGGPRHSTDSQRPHPPHRGERPSRQLRANAGGRRERGCEARARSLRRAATRDGARRLEPNVSASCGAARRRSSGDAALRSRTDLARDRPFGRQVDARSGNRAAEAHRFQRTAIQSARHDRAEGNDLHMKLRMICAAAMLAAAVHTPAVRADVFSDPDPQKKVEREQDLYEEATDAYDDHDWRRASKEFARVAGMRGSQADAALFWLAKSQNNLGLRSEALTTVVQLRTQFPKSKWNDDAKALEIEVRQSAGQKIDPGVVTDGELKVIALNALMQSDPDRATPILEKLLQGKSSSKLKDKALFFVSQSQSAEAGDILSRIARSSADPD